MAMPSGREAHPEIGRGWVASQKLDRASTAFRQFARSWNETAMWIDV